MEWGKTLQLALKSYSRKYINGHIETWALVEATSLASKIKTIR